MRVSTGGSDLNFETSSKLIKHRRSISTRNMHLNEIFHQPDVYTDGNFNTFLYLFTAKVERVRFYRVYFDIFYIKYIYIIY